jgi:rRNA maturation endonuclease Nob1
MTSAPIVRPAQAIDADALRCRGCDAPTRPGAHFCVVCGRRFTAAMNVDLLVHRSRAVRPRCERCTAPVRETTRFCTTCGMERRVARLYSA